MKEITRDRISILLMFASLSIIINMGDGGTREFLLAQCINLWLVFVYYRTTNEHTKPGKKDKHTLFGIYLFGYVFQIFLVRAMLGFAFSVVSVFTEMTWSLQAVSIYVITCYSFFILLTFVVSLNFIRDTNKSKMIIT